MRARYAETTPLLEWAHKMCEALQRGLPLDPAPDPDLVKRLQRLRRRIFFYRGARAMHTNEPKASLENLEEYNVLVRVDYGEVVIGGHDPTLGVAWNELGNANLQNNDVKRAEECFHKSIEALQNLDGATAITIAKPLISLGFAYWCQDRLFEAEATFKKALEDRERRMASMIRPPFCELIHGIL